VRTPYGAMPKRALTGTIALFDPNNARVKEETFDTDNPWQIEMAMVAGSPKGVYRLEINDDMRAFWNVKSGLQKMVVATRPIGSIAAGYGAGGRRCFFFVPEGTREFRVGFNAGHAGAFAGMVQAPDGSSSGGASFLHPDRKTVLWHWIEVKPKPEQTGKTWSFGFTGPGDMAVQFEGVPGYYALTPEQLFVPGK